MKYLGRRMFSLGVAILPMLFFIGLCAGIRPLMLLGGVACILFDVLGVLTGQLKFGGCLLFAVVPACLFDPWYEGVFLVSAALHLLNIPFALWGVLFPSRTYEEMLADKLESD